MKLPILSPANFSSLLKEVIFLKDNPTASPPVIQKILDGGYSISVSFPNKIETKEDSCVFTYMSPDKRYQFKIKGGFLSIILALLGLRYQYKLNDNIKCFFNRKKYNKILLLLSMVGEDLIVPNIYYYDKEADNFFTCGVLSFKEGKFVFYTKNDTIQVSLEHFKENISKVSIGKVKTFL